MERSRLMIGTKLLFSLVVCQFAVVLGEISLGNGFEEWYETLAKPFFAVPFWLFIPLRSFVLLLLGIALFLVLIQIDKFNKVKSAFFYFMAQIALSILLNIIFFSFHSLLGAVVISFLMVICAIIVTVKSFRISEPAGMLTIPYLIGIIYTLIFDLSLFMLNR